MKTRLLAAAGVLSVLLAACGGGNDGGRDEVRAPDETAAATDDAAVKTPDVEAAPEGGVNRPQEGTYTYAYESRQTNAATPDATPRRSSPDAEFRSKVSDEGDVSVTADSTSEGPAVSTRRHRWEDERVLELSLELKSKDTSTGCEYADPIEILHIPIKEEKFPTQEYDGTGQSCDGERTITVEREEDVLDDAGTTWRTWRIKTETIVEAPTATGLTLRSTETRWLSPDLGKEIKSQGVSEYIGSDGKVAIRAEQSVLLTSYPKA